MSRPNDSVETRRNRVTRVLKNAAELAALCTTHHWSLDHGHLVGMRDHKRGNGEPVLNEAGKVVSTYIDIAKVVGDKDHTVTGKAIDYSGRADLRLMASMGPNVVLQMKEDFEQIIADLEERLTTAEGDAEAVQHGM